MGIVKAKLDEVARQGLHFFAYFETMLEYLFVFFLFFEVDGVEANRYFIIFSECFLAGDHWKCSSGAYFDHQKLILSLISWPDILNLTNRKDHSRLSWRIEVESLLADSLFSVSAG